MINLFHLSLRPIEFIEEPKVVSLLLLAKQFRNLWDFDPIQFAPLLHIRYKIKPLCFLLELDFLSHNHLVD